MLSNLLGSYRFILQKEDSLHRCCHAQKCWYHIQKTAPSPPMAMVNASSMILPIPIAVPRDIYKVGRYFRLFAFFLGPLIICHTKGIGQILERRRPSLMDQILTESLCTVPAKLGRIPGPEHIYLVFRVVIFDELWSFTVIDIRVSTAHGPVFDDAKVSLAALLIYSEQRLADIQGNARGAHCDDNVLYFFARKFMPDKFWEMLFLFLAEWRYYLSVPDKRFFIGLTILNWWVLPLSWTVGINYGVRTYFAP